MLHGPKHFVALALACCLPSATAAQQRAVPEVPVPQGSFRDKLNDRLPTAGGSLLGLIDGNPAARIAKPMIYVSGIQNGDRTICVEIRQVSGAYAAEFTVSNPGKGGAVAFRLPKQKMDVRGRTAAELAILAHASRGPRCSLRDPVLPTSWNGPPRGKVVALINDHQADRTRMVQPQRGGDCLRLGDILPGRALTTYQVACTVQIPPGACADLPLAIQIDNAGETSFIQHTVRRDCL